MIKSVSSFSNTSIHFPLLPPCPVTPKTSTQPSFTFAGYVNESPILQELIQLGVNLTKWEKGRIPDEVIQLEPERDLRPIVRHLRRLGVTKSEDVGQILTQNPFILIYGPTIFKEKTDYFVRKKFSPEQLAVVMKGAPQLFSRSVEAIDARLGFFQSTFALTGEDVYRLQRVSLFEIVKGTQKYDACRSLSMR